MEDTPRVTAARTGGAVWRSRLAVGVLAWRSGVVAGRSGVLAGRSRFSPGGRRSRRAVGVLAGRLYRPM